MRYVILVAALLVAGCAQQRAVGPTDMSAGAASWACWKEVSAERPDPVIVPFGALGGLVAAASDTRSAPSMSKLDIHKACMLRHGWAEE